MPAALPRMPPPSIDIPGHCLLSRLRRDYFLIITPPPHFLRGRRFWISFLLMFLRIVFFRRRLRQRSAAAFDALRRAPFHYIFAAFMTLRLTPHFLAFTAPILADIAATIPATFLHTPQITADAA